MKNGFPSPLGEVGSLITSSLTFQMITQSFPSPLGEVGSLIIVIDVGSNPEETVSVPSRGSGFLNPMIHTRRYINKAFPSPLGEVGSLIDQEPVCEVDMQLFPSPLGEVGSLIVVCYDITNNCIVFPSPLGEVGSLMKSIQWILRAQI